MIKKILVANRGEIALRVMRAAHEMGIATVAIYSEADRHALHVRFASEAYCVGPPQAHESYLRGEVILEKAREAGADAIHPGYGFLSENAEFAEAVEAAGLIFIGPTADQIRAMGDKLEARRLMIAANVPVVPGTEEAIDDHQELLETARQIGYPVMIKAAGGGGGKGIRIVEDEKDLISSFERARSEAVASFKSDAVYVEKFIAKPRHIEIQVLADHHGNTVHLGERECSIQRRHQKIIEESPSPVMTEDLRERMGAAAVAAAQSVNYRNAGTVEFLVDEQLNFYFLEMNTRLQVEHPVTENVTGIDLVREQIQIASGDKLSPECENVTLRGHAIEVRIYAEDAKRDFAPSTGIIHSLETPGGPRVRLDSGLFPGMEVSVYYDPMLAKLIVRASDRAEAIARLERALREFKITGITTNIPLLLSLCRHQAFRDGDMHTHFLADHHDELMKPISGDELLELAVVAASVKHLLADQGRASSDTSEGGGKEDPWTLAGRYEQLRL